MMMWRLVRRLGYLLLGLPQPGTVAETHAWFWYAARPPAGWVLALVVLTALAVASVSFLPRNGLPWRLRLVLATLRLLGFAALLSMLAQVELHLDLTRSLPPHVAVVRDVSGSMALNDAAGASRFDAAGALRQQLDARLGRAAHLSDYDLAWDLRPHSDAAAPFGTSRLFDGLAKLLETESDLQAVILLSDGNDTAGNRGLGVAPLFAARGIPVHSVVFGRPEAARLPRVRMSGGGEYVRLGDPLQLQAVITGSDTAGDQTVAVQLFEGDASVPLAVQEGVRLGLTPRTVRFQVTPRKAGRFTYRIVAHGLRGAPAGRLLAAEHAVEVIDRRIRVLLIDQPRDERKLLSHWLARDPVVDLASLLMLPKGGWFAQGKMRHQNAGTGLPDQESDLNEYDVIILGDIPRAHFREGDPAETKLQWLVDFVERRGGGLVTLGGQSVYGAGQYEGSALAGILPFDVPGSRTPQIPDKFVLIPTPVGLNHPVMQLEADGELNRNAWLEQPQLEGCNWVGAVKPGALLMAYREHEGAKLPVIAGQVAGKGQVLALAVDTTWRWQMLRRRGDERANLPEGPDYYRTFWGNAVRALAPDPRLTPERPQIARPRQDASVGEVVTLSTRLVDRTYRPIRQADLVVRVTAPSGRTVRIYPIDSVSKPGYYEYEVALTEAGPWKVAAIHEESKVLATIDKAREALAKAKTGDDAAVTANAEAALAAATQDIVEETIQAGDSLDELDDPRAQPAVLADFAAATGGRAFGPDEVDDLVGTLALARHTTAGSASVAVWNLPSLLVFFVLLVTTDCLLRKRRGLV